MEEVQALHNLNLEWGCITNMVDRIVTIESAMDGGWPELTEMLADAMTQEGERKDPASAFFNLYAFLFRLYYRVRANPEKTTFNKYAEEQESFWITNYNYDIFVWANEKGFTKEIDNNVIKIPKDKLTEAQVRAFRRRCA